MNALVPTDAKPLRAFTRDEASKPLLVLFAAYPEPWADKTALQAKALQDAKVSAYLLAMEGLPAWSIEQSIKDYIQGRIERKRRDKMPTAEEIAAVAREHVSSEATKQLQQRAIEEQKREAAEWKAKQEWLATPEGQAHQAERAEKARAIMQRAAREVD